MKIKFIEESCIHHSCLHSNLISLFGLIFQKRKILIIITKILSFLRQENRTGVAIRLICVLDQIRTVAWSIAKLRPLTISYR